MSLPLGAKLDCKLHWGYVFTEPWLCLFVERCLLLNIALIEPLSEGSLSPRAELGYLGLTICLMEGLLDMALLSLCLKARFTQGFLGLDLLFPHSGLALILEGVS